MQMDYGVRVTRAAQQTRATLINDRKDQLQSLYH